MKTILISPMSWSIRIKGEFQRATLEGIFTPIIGEVYLLPKFGQKGEIEKGFGGQWLILDGGKNPLIRGKLEPFWPVNFWAD